jgi:hypothetical protein
MVYRFAFKSALLFLTLAACSDLPRDNALDPRNEESYTSPVVLVEAFVNLAAPGDYSLWALNSLQTLENTFQGNLLIVEYHRDIFQDTIFYDDPYNSPGNNSLFTTLQDNYIDSAPKIPRCVPDVFVNGAVNRVSGASDSASVRDQLNRLIDDLIKERNNYKIEPAAQRKGVGVYEISCRVACLGNQSANNLRMRVVAIKNLDDQEASRAATDVILSEALDNIDNGEYIEKDFGKKTLSGDPDAVIFILTSSDEKTVLQTAKVVL